MATKIMGKNTPKATKHGSPVKACQLWVRGRRKIARNSPTESDPSAMGRGQCLQARKKKLGPMFEAPDGNEGPTLQSGFFFEFLEGASAHRHIVNETSCVPLLTHQQKTSPQISVAAAMLAVTTAAVAAAARFRGRSNHGTLSSGGCVRRHSGMLNLRRSPAHGPKFHTQLLNSLGPSQNLVCFFSSSVSFSYSYTSTSDLISGMCVWQRERETYCSKRFRQWCLVRSASCTQKQNQSVSFPWIGYWVTLPWGHNSEDFETHPQTFSVKIPTAQPNSISLPNPPTPNKPPPKNWMEARTSPQPLKIKNAEVGGSGQNLKPFPHKDTQPFSENFILFGFAQVPKIDSEKNVFFFPKNGFGIKNGCRKMDSEKMDSSKVPEGHHPRGTTLREALRGNLPLKGLCGGLWEGSAGSLRGFCGVSVGFCGGTRDLPRVFGGSDPMLVTLANCWRLRRMDSEKISEKKSEEKCSPKNGFRMWIQKPGIPKRWVPRQTWHTHTHPYIYIYAVKLKTGPRFGGFKVKNWSKLKVKNWSKFFFFHCFPQFYSVLGAFLETQIVQQCVKIVFLQNLGDVKNEVFEKRIAFFVFFLFYVRKIETEKKKRKWKRPQNPIKKVFFFFLRWSSKNVKKQKKWIFSKNCLTLFVSGRENKTRIFVHTICFGQNFFGPKQCKPGKTIKIVVSAEIAQNQKWHLFFENGVFWHGWKRWVLLTVFLKSCALLKTLFLECFQQSTAFQKQKWYVEKTENLWKNSGLFLNMAKWCFLGLFFWGFSVIVVCFWCVWHSSRSVKNACFSQFRFFFFLGWLLLDYFWSWKV